MLIKAADDTQPTIDALEALLARPDVEASTRRRIEQEIRAVRAGAAGERDAAYEIGSTTVPMLGTRASLRPATLAVNRYEA